MALAFFRRFDIIKTHIYQEVVNCFEQAMFWLYADEGTHTSL